MPTLVKYFKQVGVFFFLFSVLYFTSCKKKKDTTAEILVIDATGNSVPGAYVHLYTPQGNRFNFENTTDAQGLALFNFNELYKEGSGGFGILNIDVVYNADTTTAVIEIIEEEKNQKTVQLN